MMKLLCAIALACLSLAANAQVRLLDEWYDPATRQTVTTIESRTHAEPRSPWVPAGYHLRFAPSLLGGFEASDSGLTVDGRPAWRTRLHHGRTQDGNRELGYYADEQLNRQYLLGRPLQVIDGHRALVAHKAAEGRYITGADVGWRRFYYSASIITTETLFNFAPPAYVEARIKMPDQPGVWPAFWMAAVGGTWPPEIDIIEYLGTGSADRNASRNAYFTNHFWLEDGTRRTQGGWLTGLPESIADFNVYGLLWTADEIVYYFNGREMRRIANRWPSNLQAYLLLNVAVGGTWPGTPPESAQFPAAMLVDYVRVYTP